MLSRSCQHHSVGRPNGAARNAHFPSVPQHSPDKTSVSLA